MTAVEGSSGSGKSTLLHLLGGMDTPDAGSVFYGEQNIFKWKDKKISEFRRREKSGLKSNILVYVQTLSFYIVKNIPFFFIIQILVCDKQQFSVI